MEKDIKPVRILAESIGRVSGRLIQIRTKEDAETVGQHSPHE